VRPLRVDAASSVDAASARWEDFARTDAQRYIDPGLGRNVGSEEFIEGGRAVVERALDWARPICAYDRALEIGCGVGRNTVHLARHFAQVDGVDVSPTMVGSAHERRLPEKVRLHVLSGRDLDAFDDASFAFVFSHLVFQHVTADAIIESYLREIARVLMPGGVAVLQFDTRPVSPIAALVRRLPDMLLPRLRQRGIRRHRRPASQIRELGRAAGLVLAAERDPDTAEHWFRWRLDERGIARG
jgi:SAM-dependent methyltransferase